MIGLPGHTLADDIEVLKYERFPCDDPAVSIDTASMTLKACAEPDHLTIGNRPEGIAVRNAKGLGLMDRLDVMKWTIASLQADVANQEEINARQIATNTRQMAANAQLEKEIANLKEATANYELSRERFLAVFKRGTLVNATRRDLNLFTTANALVHGGDLAFDKRFIDAGRRTDGATFIALYGLDPVSARHFGVLTSTETSAQPRSDLTVDLRRPRPGRSPQCSRIGQSVEASEGNARVL